MCGISWKARKLCRPARSVLLSSCARLRFGTPAIDRGDPIIENRSALVALAILLGHERIESVVGQVLDDRLREVAKRTCKESTCAVEVTGPSIFM